MPRVVVGALSFGAIGLVACGGSSVERDAAPPSVADFPAPDGRTLDELIASTEPTDEIVVAPAGQVVNKGTSRFPFGVFTDAREPINDAQVAIYVARAKDGVARGPAHGPFPAQAKSLATDAAYSSETTAQDELAPKTFYVADLELDKKGEWQLIAMFDDGEELRTTRVPSLVANRFDDVPKVGDDAILISTPTADDVGGDLTKIDTRTPPSTMHEDNFADVIGEKPVVLLFATPALCQSRVCGPVVDIAEQVKEETDADVSFIHMEIFQDNQFDNGPRRQVEAYNLPTEPWVFVFDADGTVSTAIEGAFSTEELREAVDAVS
jgi:hypothetical protein